MIDWHCPDSPTWKPGHPGGTSFEHAVVRPSVGYGRWALCAGTGTANLSMSNAIAHHILFCIMTFFWEILNCHFAINVPHLLSRPGLTIAFDPWCPPSLQLPTLPQCVRRFHGINARGRSLKWYCCVSPCPSLLQRGTFFVVLVLSWGWSHVFLITSPADLMFSSIWGFELRLEELITSAYSEALLRWSTVANTSRSRTLKAAMCSE